MTFLLELEDSQLPETSLHIQRLFLWPIDARLNLNFLILSYRRKLVTFAWFKWIEVCFIIDRLDIVVVTTWLLAICHERIMKNVGLLIEIASELDVFPGQVNRKKLIVPE